MRAAAGLAVLLALALIAAQHRPDSQTGEALARAYAKQPTAARRAALIAYASRHRKEVSGALAWLAVGAQDAVEKRDTEALAHLKNARGRLPSLDDYIAYLTATADFDLQDDEAAIHALEPVWAHSPKSPLLARSALLAARAYTRHGDPRKALELLKKFYDDLPQPQGDQTLATCFEAASDPVNAAAYYQRVYYAYPTSPQAADARAALDRLRAALGPEYPPEMPDAMLGRAVRLIEGGNYRQARTELETLAPLLGGAQRDIARVRIGTAEYKAHDDRAAFDYLKSLAVSSPDADAERLYYLLATARRLNDTAEMNTVLDSFARLYPQSSWRMQALVWAGNNFVVENQPDAYLPLFRACYESFPKSSEAPYCHWKVTFDDYLHRRPEARGMLKAQLHDYPDSGHAMATLYFLGRLAEQSAEFGEARAYYEELNREYPNYYYAVLARERLREPKVAAAAPSAVTRRFLASIAFPPRVRNVDFRPDPLSLERMARSRLLGDAALDNLAELELQFGAHTESQPQVMAIALARAAARREAPDQAIRYIKRYAPGYLFIPMDSAPREFWKLAFPLPYRGALERYSRAQGLDPYLVAAIVLQESEFNPKAISRADAYGLTQILPSTGRELSRKMRVRRFHPRMLFQPDFNLRLGTFYLRSLFDQLHDQWEPTLAAYNAGKSRAVAWMGWADFREPAEFVEAIPFTETRNYIEIVIRNADVYRRLYAPRQR
jgi:peptidoglycan lytic transglycosylase